MALLAQRFPVWILGRLERIDVRGLSLSEHRRQHVGRELLLGCAAVTLLAHQPAFELAVALQHLEVKRLEPVTLLAGLLECVANHVLTPLQLVEAFDEAVEVGHPCVVIDAPRVVNNDSRLNGKAVFREALSSTASSTSEACPR